ncbi:hypothetical protein IAT38_001140 [Cryptococcus sp. DSM 104549]
MTSIFPQGLPPAISPPLPSPSASALPPSAQPAPRITLQFPPAPPAPNAPTFQTAPSNEPQPPPPPSADSRLSSPDEEEDELMDDESLGGPAPSTATSTPGLPGGKQAGSSSGSVKGGASPRDRGVGYGTGSGKSRKSSCAVCHHRKIKCDQLRPSCSSCTRKGHQCKYLEEDEHYRNHVPPRAHSSRTPLAVDPQDPSSRHLMPSTGANGEPSTEPAPFKNGHANSGEGGRNGNSSQPEWNVGGPERAPKSNGSDKAKKKERRERIVNGFDSDSDDDMEDAEKDKAVKSKAPANDLDGELAALVGEQEVDELEDDLPDKPAASNKRSMSIDDDISGELLELASAPPKKKKKKVTVMPPAAVQGQHKHSSRPVPLPLAKPGTPGQLSFPPTPSTSTPLAHVHVNSPHNLGNTARNDPYSFPIQNLSHSIPPAEMVNYLFNVFWRDPFLTEGISMMRNSFLSDYNGFMERRALRLQVGDATTLAMTFAILAVSYRIFPDDVNRLVLATQPSNIPTTMPRGLSRILTGQPASVGDTTPLDQRYLDLALLCGQVAEQYDPPGQQLVAFKLVLYRYCMLGIAMGGSKDRQVLAGTWLAQGIKVAQSLGLGKEWEGLTHSVRESRRRLMWALYVADRHYSFETSFPYTMLDAHQGIHLPSPMSEQEIEALPVEIRELPPVLPDAGPSPSTALFIHTHLARRITPILDSFSTITAANTPHELVLRFDSSLDTFQDALPPFFRVFPLTDTVHDGIHPYLPSHRVRLHATLFAYRMGVHRTHLPTYLDPSTPRGVRNVIAQVCLSALRVQRSAKMLDHTVAFRLFCPATVFECAATLALIMWVEKAVNADAGVPAPSRAGELMAFRGGVAEALELLDGSIAGVGGTYSRKAVVVVRALLSVVDAPPEPLFLNGDGTPNDTKPGLSMSIDGPAASLPPGAEHSSASPTTVGHSRPATAPPAPGASEGPQQPGYSGKVLRWLAELVKGGCNVEMLLKEAEWTNGWERVVAAMR